MGWYSAGPVDADKDAFHRNRAGTCRRAAASTSLWSVNVLRQHCRDGAAWPGTRGYWRARRPMGGSRSLFPGGSRPFLVGTGSDQGGVHVDDPPAGQRLCRRYSSHGNPAGMSSISFHTCARALARARAILSQHGRRHRPCPGRGTVGPLGASPSTGARCASRAMSLVRGPERDHGRQRHRRRCPGRRRATLPFFFRSAALSRARRSVPPGRRP